MLVCTIETFASFFFAGVGATLFAGGAVALYLMRR